MQQLLLLLKKYQVFFVFIVLEIFSFWLIINYNKFQNAAFLNTSNVFVGSILSVSSNVSGYFSLKEENAFLAEENALLKQQIVDFKQLSTLSGSSDEVLTGTIKEFDFIPTKIINNSIFNDDNYITINKGKNHGIYSGMGIVTGNGIVGKVTAVSNNYSTVQSFLHSSYQVSAQIKSNKILGAAIWKGEDIETGHLLYVPRHENVVVNDTVVTSGYNAIFPEGIPIGIIEEITIPENESFYDIKIKLLTEFNKLYFVYAVKNNTKAEQDSLSQQQVR